MGSPQDLLSPIKQQKVYVRIVDQFIDLINRGEFKPGMQLPPERELAQHLGVSRASLREALTVLDLMGYITTTSGQGTRICEKGISNYFSASSLDNLGESPFMILQARKILEPGNAKVVAKKHTPQGIQNLNEILAQIDTDVSEVHVLSDIFFEGDRQFHMEIARMTENPLLILMYEILDHQMHEKLWMTLNRYTGFNTPGRWEQASQEHHAIFDAIASGDSQLAARQMHAHLLQVEEVMTRAELTSDKHEDSTMGLE